MEWKTNGVDLSIWVLPESFTYLEEDVDAWANKQNTVSPMLSLPRAHPLPPLPGLRRKSEKKCCLSPLS